MVDTNLYINPTQLLSEYLGISLELAVFIMTVITIWSLTWKGLALWKAAGKKQVIWFIALLVINTIGILEILYIYIFSEIKLPKNTKTLKAPEIKRKKKSSKKKTKKK
ncbi:hypothetical protein GF386_01390 [Candidatus Pacearchaeota archaeon]|nr:hypothetical protein [Candidatus Pacearchaeota archaeon]